LKRLVERQWSTQATQQRRRSMGVILFLAVIGCGLPNTEYSGTVKQVGAIHGYGNIVETSRTNQVLKSVISIRSFKELFQDCFPNGLMDPMVYSRRLC